MISEGNTKGCFQLESQLAQSTSKKVKPKTIEELSDIIAIIRPGCLDAKFEKKNVTNHYIDRHNCIEPVVYDHPSLEPIMDKTKGLLIYQEQALRIAQDIAGFSPNAGNQLRKGIGKKLPEIIQKLKVKFIDGCKETGIVDEETAERLFENIEKSQRYSFNKCLSPDTLVETEDGCKKTIDKLKVGEYINCPGGYYKVINKYENGVHDTFQLRLADGSRITCTAEHKFLCEDGEIRPWYQILVKQRRIICKRGCLPIVAVLYCGLKRTIDIEVDNHEHIFYANNIATSNSHSASYAYMAYQTAYFKAHFPLAFFNAYLCHAKDKPKPKEEIAELIQNARIMDIDVLPPDFRKLNLDFRIYGEDIYFGLIDIKGIGQSIIEQLQREVSKTEEQLDKRIDKWTWLDFLLYFSPYIKAPAVKALICTGALDYFGLPRTQMYYEFENVDLRDKEKAWVINHHEQNPELSLIELLSCLTEIPAGRKHGGCTTKPRVQKIHDLISVLKNPPFPLLDSIAWIAGVEEELMGISLSCTKVDDCDTEIANCNCRGFIKGYKRPGPILLAAKIDRVKEILTKKKQKMAFLTVSDITGSIESIVLFPNIWADYSDVCFEGNTVMIQGKRGDKDKDTLIVDKIWNI